MGEPEAAGRWLSQGCRFGTFEVGHHFSGGGTDGRQLPPSLQADPDRLGRFLELLKRDRHTPRIHPVFQFRHRSWFTEGTYDVLGKAGATLCTAHSSRYPCVEEVTADLVYYRFHGPKEFFASKYSPQRCAAIWRPEGRYTLTSIMTGTGTRSKTRAPCANYLRQRVVGRKLLLPKRAGFPAFHVVLQSVH
jgi:hypothetical protein